MKNGKAPTKKQKIVIKEAGLDPDNWLIYKKVSNTWHLINRETGAIEKISV